MLQFNIFEWKNYFNQWTAYTQTSYKDQPLLDPYAFLLGKKISNEGWFTAFMPDLNQKNPVVTNFLIQHAIWCTEFFGIDGWRVDTYFYGNPEFSTVLMIHYLLNFLCSLFWEKPGYKR